MTFQIGEKVVYPNQGVGTIENIRAWTLGSQFEKCYLLRMVYGSITVTVPFSKVANIGLRPIAKNTQICRILSYLADRLFAIQAATGRSVLRRIPKKC